MARTSSAQTSVPLQLELRAAMATQGCPLCRLAARAERAFVDSLAYERVLDLKTRDALKASRGLCDHHSRVWQSVQGAALGIAIVTRVSVLDLLRDTEPGKEPSSSVFRRRGRAAAICDRLQAAAACPACITGEDAAVRFGELLLTEFREAETRALFVACGGLCLPHLRTVLMLRGAEPVYEALMDAQRQAWTQLMGGLEAFIRKNDYRFVDEPMTSQEGTSWTRALDTLTGLEGSRGRD